MSRGFAHLTGLYRVVDVPSAIWVVSRSFPSHGFLGLENFFVFFAKTSLSLRVVKRREGIEYKPRPMGEVAPLGDGEGKDPERDRAAARRWQLC